MEFVKLTPAQKELIELLAHKEVHDYLEALKTVHYLATYGIREEMVELWASRYVHNLLDVIQSVALEDYLLKSRIYEQ